MDAPCPDWIAEQRLAAARAMRNAVSATHLIRHREGLGWTVRPAAGSVLASPRIASWDPEPDYFHHWIRDSAIVLRAVPLAIKTEPEMREFWLRFIADFIDFSLHISDTERRGPQVNTLKDRASPEYQQYLRPEQELASLSGSRWLEEPRFSADGSADPEQWGRPQDDGPALRSSSLMVLLDELPEAASEAAEQLIARDLAHLVRVAGRPCIGPWEEWPPRRSFFTMLVQWDALQRGRERGAGNEKMKEAARSLTDLLELAYDPATGGWRESIEAPGGHLDSAACLAILHAGRVEGKYAMTAPRTRATVAELETVFADLYPINRDRAVPAIGRWATDVYFDGNPWYPVTLGMAELHYRIASETQDEKAFAKAEGWMALIQQVAPKPAGPLPEQFDRATGKPASCLDLTWSAAAFLGASSARERAVQAMTRAR